MKFDRSSLLLYAVTDRGRLVGRTLPQAVEAVIRGGATLVQLREKGLDYPAFRAEALEVLAVCRRHGVPLLINDNVELALEIGADGVHVGQDDLEAGQARVRLGPDKLIGGSAHTVEEALRARAAGADYLGAGAVFPTGTKGDTGALPLERLRAICAAVDIPVVAIGGIGPDNIERLTGTGIAGVAVVSALFAQPDPEQATRTLRALAARAVGV